MTEEIGIVVGTTNTMIYKPGNGIVLCEPTKVAYNGDPKLGRVRAVGTEAAAMIGKVPEKTVLSFPVTCSTGFCARCSSLAYSRPRYAR